MFVFIKYHAGVEGTKFCVFAGYVDDVIAEFLSGSCVGYLDEVAIVGGYLCPDELKLLYCCLCFDYFIKEGVEGVLSEGTIDEVVLEG